MTPSEGTPLYVIVTPARDEAAYLPDLARSLFAQTVPFTRWVIVDDGSTDGTLELARGYEAADGRVTVHARGDRPDRRAGCGDIEAFNAGLALVGDVDRYDFVGKLDADLVLPPDYFERLFAEFAARPRLGIAGGHCYNRSGGRVVLDKVPDSHVRGATKTFRRECFRDLKALPEVPGWDTVDEVKARARGWETQSLRDPGVIHQKPVTGGSGSVLHGRFVLGRISHYLGYRPSYVALRVVRNVGKPPYVAGGVAMACGYVSGVLRRERRLDDPEFRQELRAYQRERVAGLFRGGGAPARQGWDVE
jgi:poly-beta-1,6-N-acetyl-D-glucosamine synthase